jgi:hypothetical protein
MREHLIPTNNARLMIAFYKPAEIREELKTMN